MKLFITVFLFSICGFSQGLPAELIQGQWIAKYPIFTRPSDLFMSFDFKNDEMKLNVKCVFSDLSKLDVTATVKVNYVGNEIYIQESQSMKTNVGEKSCGVSLTQTKWQFYFNATGEAVLFAAVPYGAQFQLIRP